VIQYSLCDITISCGSKT